MSTTRYVTWSLHTKSRASLKAMLNRVRAWPAPDAPVSAHFNRLAPLVLQP